MLKMCTLSTSVLFSSCVADVVKYRLSIHDATNVVLRQEISRLSIHDTTNVGLRQEIGFTNPCLDSLSYFD